MKRKFLIFALIIFGFTMLSIFMMEKTDIIGLGNVDMDAVCRDEDGRIVLSWSRLPYPCFYKVETYSHTTGILKEEPDSHLVTSAFTFETSYEVPSTAIPMFYRVTAYGMFGKLAGPTEPVENPRYSEPLVPVSIFHYTESNPASPMPYLVWHVVPNAVCYELELLSSPPEKEGGIKLSSKNHLFSTRQIFTNGYQADLRKYVNMGSIYWRVRALGLHHEPIGEFSKAEPLLIDKNEPIPNYPLINNFDYMPDFQQPLYPAYAWIPMHGVKEYEVELLIHPPQEPNGKEPDPERIWYEKSLDTCSCYDEYSRPYAGEYYWRVRGIDKDGKTIGRYSDAEEFIVKDPGDRVYAAVFGDSVVHGGGALSYAPCSLEYSFSTYLDFPALNLGKSGDTSNTSLERFDEDVLRYRPKNLIILTGCNSLRAEDIKAKDIIADLEGIRKKCEKNGIRPIFLTLMPLNPKNIKSAFQTDTDPDWEDKMDEVNDYIREQPAYVDIETFFYDSKHEVMDYHMAIDGLHPDLKGKMLIGEAVNRRKDLLR